MGSLREWLRSAPPATMVSAAEVLARLDTPEPAAVRPTSAEPVAAERIWSCPEQTRFTVAELAEALHRPTSYLYGLTRSGRIPHLKLDGRVMFVAKEVRIWIASREERIVRQQSAPITSRPRRTA